MFCSYTRGEHQKHANRFLINALSSCRYFSKVLLHKRGIGNEKVIQKKEEKKKKELRKNRHKSV
jgi:phosphoribosyl-ATP pyrophosphohydrolase